MTFKNLIHLSLLFFIPTSFFVFPAYFKSTDSGAYILWNAFLITPLYLTCAGCIYITNNQIIGATTKLLIIFFALVATIYANIMMSLPDGIWGFLFGLDQNPDKESIIVAIFIMIVSLVVTLVFYLIGYLLIFFMLKFFAVNAKIM